MGEDHEMFLSVGERGHLTRFVNANPRTAQSAGVTRLWAAYRALESAYHALENAARRPTESIEGLST